MDSEDFAVLKAHSKEKKERNKQYGTEQLAKAGYSFSSHNAGYHLVIVHESCTIDYWPSTGKWKDRTSSVYHRGLSNLLSYLEA